MSSKDEELAEEATWELSRSEDSRVVTLKITAPEPIDTHLFVILLEVYLQDLIKAYRGQPDDDKDLH